MNNIEHNNTSDNSRILEIGKEVKEKIFTQEIEDIVELTYGYVNLKDGTNWNTSLFNRFIRNNYDIPDKNNLDEHELIDFFHEYNPKQDYVDTKIEILSDIEGLVKKSLNIKIEEIDKYIEEINRLSNLDKDGNTNKELFISSLNYTRNMLEMALYGLPFELEKAGLPISIDEKEIDYINSKIDELEEENFGGKISENPEEVALVYSFMKSNYDNFILNLSESEQKDYEKYLEEIKKYLPENYEYTKKEQSKRHNVYNLEIPREKYVRFFELLPEISESPVEVIISGQYKNMYDTDGKLYIPDNEDYKTKPLKYINPLSVHETTHAVTLKQGKNNFNGFKGSGFLLKEEGLAVTSENILKGIELQVGLGDPRILIGELFDGKNTENFIDLHNRLNPELKSGDILRNKRNRRLTGYGSQHKDTTYGRGLRAILKILKTKSKRKKKLFIGKMNLEFIEKYGDSYNVPDTVVYPLIFGELINYFSENYYDDPNFKITHDGFTKYMNAKYDYINMDEFEGLKNRVFRDRSIVKQVNEMKKIVKELIDNNRIS